MILVQDVVPLQSQASIKARFHGPHREEPRTVALACLSESREFVLELHQFMSAFYTETAQSNGQDDEAWGLTCQLVYGIFFQLNLVRLHPCRRVVYILQNMVSRVQGG
jgi:hypothetical protein